MTKEELLKVLIAVSEQLAEWSIDGILCSQYISSYERKQLTRLELMLETAIVKSGGEW